MLAGRQKLLLEVLIMMLVLVEMNDSNYKMKYLSVLASCSRLLLPFLLTNLARMSQVITLPSFIVHLPRLIPGPLSPGSISYFGRHPLLLRAHGPRKIEFLKLASTLAFHRRANSTEIGTCVQRSISSAITDNILWTKAQILCGV